MLDDEGTTIDLPALPGLRVLRRLGSGGMGAVYLAVDPTTGRTVALKVVLDRGPAALSARARFAREIAAVSAVSHRNVVRLLRAGVIAGVPFAMFERAHGRSLSRIGPQPWPIVVDIGRQLADAIAAIHASGWMHRDITPSNVMVNDHAFVTLIDFGLAKPIGARVADLDGPMTAPGAVVGTRRYLAPELLRNRPHTPAADVYGLALALVDLLDGPVPGPLADVLERALDRQPRNRPGAAEIAATLDELHAAQAMQTRTA